jgi:hypothetical protein
MPYDPFTEEYLRLMTRKDDPACGLWVGPEAEAEYALRDWELRHWLQTPPPDYAAIE